ncbi:MAG TPA: potassium channel family protein [Methanoregula sp.]|nr:potassium channel family protein [Methanoregula sp.]
MNRISFRFQIYIAVFLCVIVGGMIALMVGEGFSPLDAFYFIIVTIATVGYGDLYPVTPLGKVTVIIVILFGVGVFIGLVANSIEYFIYKRERAERLKKMNMIIGVLFSELGIRLLKLFGEKDSAIGEIRAALVVADKWSEDDFKRAYDLLENHSYAVKSQDFDLEALRDRLRKREDFMIRLLENPELLEHEAFTELMQALFHLNEELVIREQLTGLPQTDYNHLSVDINRAYRHLALTWLRYMQHLKAHYPYLFSLAMRTNPFDANASPIVR